MKFSFTSLCMLRFVRLEYENDDLGLSLGVVMGFLSLMLIL
jgi:hypothetical protein